MHTELITRLSLSVVSLRHLVTATQVKQTGLTEVTAGEDALHGMIRRMTIRRHAIFEARGT